jgi:hypothetical protein
MIKKETKIIYITSDGIEHSNLKAALFHEYKPKLIEFFNKHLDGEEIQLTTTEIADIILNDPEYFVELLDSIYSLSLRTQETPKAVKKGEVR